MMKGKSSSIKGNNLQSQYSQFKRWNVSAESVKICYLNRQEVRPDVGGGGGGGGVKDETMSWRIIRSTDKWRKGVDTA